MALHAVKGKGLVTGCLAISLGIFSSGAMAAGEFDPVDHPEVRAMIDSLDAKGLDRSKLIQVMQNAELKQSIIKAMTRPAERHLRWDEYRNIFIQPKRAQAGAAFIEKYHDAMMRAQQEYGVPPEIIAAIIGVETSYGGNKGSYRVIDALSTLAFEFPRRADFFRKELEAYLDITLNQGLDPLALKGSYAGAMGYPQFMPTSYQAYAVDFNGDGIKDLWNEPEDAIGSVASYFSRHHWQSGEPIYIDATGPMTPPGAIAFNQVSKGTSTTIAALEQAGIKADGALPSNTSVLPVALDFEDGHTRYVLGMPNFYVITRYNHSHLYAMAVTTLAEHIKDVMAQEK
ncbi:lytic murein transglycosylase B [Larsenimonas rhizosphaerae]|uniref:Lytic murein transglycosylase B n=1 Tax=Larsenimonas rhizosphaerae TaxID=2944682 RepID=A0AA41ZDZ6_9GAMM|nr:lytic murein transglycosylase B [Larsenimonas rhizosphaerae]MCX2523539.1 lytic murein transglycosylase B [Larsenimonas rhizosphaerae]